jgi:hypothetical protein
MPGFFEVRLRNGLQEYIAIDDVASVMSRIGGGTIIHRKTTDRPILVDVDLSVVVAAMGGGDDRAA